MMLPIFEIMVLYDTREESGGCLFSVVTVKLLRASLTWRHCSGVPLLGPMSSGISQIYMYLSACQTCLQTSICIIACSLTMNTHSYYSLSLCVHECGPHADYRLHSRAEWIIGAVVFAHWNQWHLQEFEGFQQQKWLSLFHGKLVRDLSRIRPRSSREIL